MSTNNNKQVIYVNPTNCSYPCLTTGKTGVVPSLNEDTCILFSQVEKEDCIRIYIQLSFKNPVIKDMLKKGKASVICKWICRRTNEFDFKKTQSLEFHIDIPKTKVCSNVQIKTFIITNEYIPEYRNNFAKNLNVSSVCLYKGEYLVIFPTYKINYNLGLFNVDKMGSIYNLICDPSSEGGIKVDLSGDDITIIVPKDIFEILKTFGENSPEYKLCISSFTTIANIEAINSLRCGLSDDRKWARAIEMCMKKKNLSLNDDELDVTVAAQKILDMALDTSIRLLEKSTMTES